MPRFFVACDLCPAKAEVPTHISMPVGKPKGWYAVDIEGGTEPLTRSSNLYCPDCFKTIFAEPASVIVQP